MRSNHMTGMQVRLMQLVAQTDLQERLYKAQNALASLTWTEMLAMQLLVCSSPRARACMRASAVSQHTRPLI